ncbi:MAG: hypothetical protein U0L18_03030 [Acutalibacteraceae bacterium]|nr:hypothetical protein [Acutalibacteraceae bacterium]
MIKKLKKENGSVTIEATISLSAFMFAIVTILTIVNICIVQARVSYALNTTAKEISQYSYLYSLTGLNDSQSKLYEAGVEGTEGVSKILGDINTVYNEIENLGQTGKQTPDNIDAIMTAWDSAVGSVEKIEAAGSSIYDTISEIAKDPKNLMFGIAKLAASEGFDLAKSRLIAAPLTKAMIQKHLVSTKDGSVESYLKSLGVVPSANGSYLDGLDFSKSTLFPYGSNEIRLKVSYDVKVIALLPIDFSFHFNQTAVTHGWLSGDQSFQSSAEYIENDTLWTKSTVSERVSLIRHMVIDDMEDQGYAKTSGLTDVQLYNSELNEFAMIASMNPLWSAPGEDPKTLADLDDVALEENIERLCGKITSTTDGVDKITTKTENNGQVTKTEHDCSGATNKIILVIPEDEGLKERIETIIAKSDTKGVTIEVVASYGNGASSTAVKSDEGGTGE